MLCIYQTDFNESKGLSGEIENDSAESQPFKIENEKNSFESKSTVKADFSLFPENILSDLNEARKFVINYARDNFPKAVINNETGKEIGIGRHGLDKLLSGNISLQKYATAFFVPDIIKKANKVTYANNYHEKTLNQIPTFEYYDTQIKIGNKDYIAHTRVKNTHMGDKYYGHTISKIVDNIEIEPSARTLDENSPKKPVNAIEDSINNNIPQNVSEVKEFSAQKETENAHIGEKTIWANKDFDQPIVIKGYAGEFEGRDYMFVEGSDSAIPLDIIVFTKETEASNDFDSGKKDTLMQVF